MKVVSTCSTRRRDSEPVVVPKITLPPAWAWLLIPVAPVVLVGFAFFFIAFFLADWCEACVLDIARYWSTRD